jgi:hypothetical protein
MTKTRRNLVYLEILINIPIRTKSAGFQIANGTKMPQGQSKGRQTPSGFVFMMAATLQGSLLPSMTPIQLRYNGGREKFQNQDSIWNEVSKS